MQEGPFVQIEPLDRKRHDRSTFSCGAPALDAYLQRQASQDMEKHVAVVYVALIEPPTIAGYYTLSQFSIDLVHLPDAIAKRLPRYPVVPATLLGRLAVSSALRGQRIGESLLFDALHRSLLQSAHLASTGVLVDAKDDNAAAFYRRYGFTQILDAGSRLFLPMKTIEQMFSA
jgi:ribosomal protein S18 acetylase RimI-like enzyme